MRKRYKVIMIIIAVIAILIGALTVYMKFFRKQSSEVTNKSSVVANIKEYGYTLDDRDSDLMKEEFNNLKEVLSTDEINYEEYAKSLSKLFVIDLFTIENKINKYDVGGLEYLLESEQEKFKNIILDSIYANVLDNSYQDRKQELPEVKNVTIDNVTESSYLKGEESVSSYVVELSWDYVEDLGYDYKASITLINEDNKLFVVEYNPLTEDVEEGEVE